MASELFVNKITGTSGTSDDAAITLSGNNATLVNIANFTGMIAPFAMTSAPTGWLTCDGTAVSRTTYSDLYTAIGTTWGSGDGTSTFNLPDLRGAFLRGTGTHTETMGDGTTAFVGPSVGSFQDDAFQKHQHTMRGDSGGSGNLVLATNNADKSGVTNTIDQIPSGTGYVEHDSGGTPRVDKETRPFNAGVNYCIKI